MSRATKRKHVLLEVMQDDFSLPTEGQEIVKVLSSRGNNLHEVESSSEETYLVSMPTKFRKNVWVKRGDFILVEPIPEGDKVKAEIVRILTNEHVKYFKKSGAWPDAFGGCKQVDTQDEDDLFINTNRQHLENNEEESEESSTEETEESDTEGNNS